MNQHLLHYYGALNKGMYDHFIVNRQDDYSYVKSEDSEDFVSQEPMATAIKPRKTKFPPQSFHNCLFCGRWYRSKTSLGLHQRLECGKEPAFQCPHCPLKTHQKGNLQVHIKKRHSTDNGDKSQLKSKNPILAQELAMVSNTNRFQLGLSTEISSELTITRSQTDSNCSRTPNLSHILSQPNIVRATTQVSETNAPFRFANNQTKVRVKGIVNIPSGIEISHKRHQHENVQADVSITPTLQETSADEHELTTTRNYIKPSEAKKLPELTRILNSQDPIPPHPLIIESLTKFSTTPSETSLPNKETNNDTTN